MLNRKRASSKSDIEKKLDRSLSRERRPKNLSMDLKDHILPTYYMKSLQYHYNLSNLSTDKTKKFKEHFLSSLASIRYLKKIKIPSMDNMLKSRVQLARLENSQLTSRI